MRKRKLKTVLQFIMVGKLLPYKKLFLHHPAADVQQKNSIYSGSTS